MTYLLSKNYEDKQPVFLQDPYIDGTPQVGNTLTVRWFVPGYSATDPDWSVEYQWYWGAEDTTLTEEEFDETGQTLIPTTDHLSGYLSCRVAVTNPSGTVVKFAANVGPVTDYSAPSGTVVTPPQFTQEATLVGTPQAGRTLSVNYAVAEVPGISYSYQFTWFRDADGVDSPSPDETVSGATASQYTAGAADVTNHLKCRVRCSNLAGTTESITTYSAEIQPADESIPVDATVIDAGWLASTANGGPDGPWILKGSGKYFYCTTDITRSAPSGSKSAMFYVASPDITLDLNGHTLTYHSGTAPATLPSGGTVVGQGHVGICLYIDWYNTEIAISGATSPNNFILKNGTLIGTGNGVQGNAIYGYRSLGIAIKNMRIEAAPGQDAMVLACLNHGGKTVEVTDSILIATTTTSRNRHDGPANLKNGEGAMYVARNVIAGGNSGIICGSNSLIEDNIIAQNSTVTNGYSIWLYRNSGVVARNNICIPTTGRGFLCNAGSNHTFDGNVLLHLEEANAEFNDVLNPPALRARYDFSNIAYTNNFSLGIASNAYTACSTMYVGQSTINGIVQSVVQGNTGYAVWSGTGEDNDLDYARAFALENHVGPGQTDFSNNALYSNHQVVGVEGYDGQCVADPAYPFRNNTLGFADGDTAYAAFAAALDAKLAEWSLTADVLAEAQSRIASAKSLASGLCTGQPVLASAKFWFTLWRSEPSFCDLLDTTFAGGASPLSYAAFTTARTGSRAYRDKVSAYVRIMNESAPVASQTVTVTPVVISTSAPGGDVFSAITDANGYVELQAIRNALTRGVSSGNLTAQTETHVDIAVAGVGSTQRVAIGDFPNLTTVNLGA